MTLTLSPVAVFAARCVAPVASLALWDWGHHAALHIPFGFYLALATVGALTNAGELRERRAAREPARIDPARIVRDPHFWMVLLTSAIFCGAWTLLASRPSPVPPRTIACSFLALATTLGAGFGRRTAPSSPYVSYRWRGSAIERAWLRVRACTIRTGPFS